MLTHSAFIDHSDPSSFLAVDQINYDEVGAILSDNLQEFLPHTRIRKGDTVILREPTSAQKLKRTHVPVTMKVHLVISMSTYKRFSTVYDLYRRGVFDEAVEYYRYDLAKLFEENSYVKPSHRNEAVFYCHGFPHSMHPNTAGWFLEKHLLPVNVVCPTEPWEGVLDRQRTEYEGHETIHGVVLDLAPMRYGLGQKWHAPFDYEEKTYQTLALLGFEQSLISTVHPRFYTPVLKDED